MAFQLADLPKGSRLRKAAVAAYATGEAAKVVGDGRARTPQPQRKRARAGRPTYRCHQCQTLTFTWAAAQRHADTERHHRIEIVLESS